MTWIARFLAIQVPIDHGTRIRNRDRGPSRFKHQGTKLPGDLETSKPGQTGPAGILVLQVYRLCRPLSRHGTAINMVSGSQVKRRDQGPRDVMAQVPSSVPCDQGDVLSLTPWTSLPRPRQLGIKVPARRVRLDRKGSLAAWILGNLVTQFAWSPTCQGGMRTLEPGFVETCSTLRHWSMIDIGDYRIRPTKATWNIGKWAAWSQGVRASMAVKAP